jgi:hypothetical protein
VQGVLYRDVPDTAWGRLNRFEGEMYSCRSVSVDVRDGRTVTAQTYVLHATYHPLLELREWNFESFLGQHKSRFVSTYVGYKAL